MRKLIVCCLLTVMVGCGGEEKEADRSETGDSQNVSLTDGTNQDLATANHFVGMDVTAVKPAKQEEAKQEEAKHKEAKQEEASEEEAAEAEETIKSVMAEFNVATKAFMKEYRAAKTDEERSSIVKEGMPKPGSFAERLMPLVESDPGSEDAVLALTWIIQRARGDVTERAAEIFLEHHLDSDGIVNVAITKMRNPPTQANQDFLQKLIDKSSEEQQRLKGVASYAKVMSLQNGRRTYDFYKKQLDSASESMSEEDSKFVGVKKSYDDFVESLSDNARSYYETGSLADGQNIEAMFEAIQEQFADVVLMERGDVKILIGDKCESTLFELRNLLVGKTAPDIEGEDLDGEEFKLSDYRGKVVVIDFWGDW